MRIAHIATDLPNKSYGVGHCYYGMETALARRGHHSTHIAQNGGWRMHADSPVDADGARILMARSFPKLRGLGPLAPSLNSVVFQWSSGETLRRAGRNEMPDLVMGYGCDTVGAALYAKRRNRPFVHFLFGPSAAYLATYDLERDTWGVETIGFNRRSDAVKRRVLQYHAFLESQIAARADLWVVTCCSSRNEIIQAYGLAPEKVFVVPMGVDAAAFQTLSGREESRARLGIGDGDFVFLAIGQTIWVKGMLWFLRAIEEIRPQLTEKVKFVLAGFHHRDALQRAIEERGLAGSVICLGPQSQEEVRRLYAMADAFVMCSVREGFALVILEALSAGLPLVSTKVGCAPYLLTDRVNALLVEPRDSRGLGAALLRIWRERELRESLKAAGKIVAQKHSWDLTAAMLDEAYAKLVH